MTATTTLKRLAASLLAAGGLAALAVLLGPAGPAAAAPQGFDLWADSGTATMPGGQSVTVWGYTANQADPIGRPGGRTLVVTEGDQVTITLHNELAEPTSLLVQGQQMVPDLTGADQGQAKDYTFTADQPGTYLYEAGPLVNGQHQVAMGLYGALVVRPAGAPLQAYADPGSAFDDEAVLVLGEIDPALNNAPDPASFDLRSYAPRYFVVNGKAYPDIASVDTTAGHRVLLRYVNAGMQYHSMAVLGVHQKVIALDGSPLGYARRYVAETFGPGQTADAIVVPTSSAQASTLPIYDASLLLHNSNVSGTGGMLSTVAAAPDPDAPAPVVPGPVTSEVAWAGSTLTAKVTAASGANVAAAEYFVDDVQAAAGTMTGTFGTGTVSVSTGVTLGAGGHVLYVRGRDSSGNWGPLSSVLVNGGDAGGPTTSSPTLTPALANATGPAVAVSATGDDTASGGSNIDAAEYFIDTVGGDGSGEPLSVNAAAAVASLDGTITATQVAALDEGNHAIWIHSKDAQGNWGDAVSINLAVDETAPGTSGLSAVPNPNNGTLAFNTAVQAVRVMATTLSDPVAHDVNSTIRGGEVFIDTVGANGSGIPLTASDGAFNDPSEGGYADIPLATVRSLGEGPHTLSVHAKDAAGNWGAMATTTLLVDKTGPAVSAVAVTPTPTQGAATVVLSGTTTDLRTAVTKAEWFTGTDPGLGNGTPMALSGADPLSQTATATINVRSWNEGTYTLRVRAKDAAGNWGTSSSVVLTVTGPVFFSTLGNTNPPGVAGTADDADIYAWSGSAYNRTYDVTAAPFNLPAGAAVDGFDRVDATHFYLSFSGTTTSVPGIGNVQDEDVVYWNGTSWSVYFDGTTRGLTAADQDVDAINVDGGTLYFSTVGNTNPPGAGGAADDADIYSWNGTAFARVWDASANGLAAGANVDGFVRVDGTHFYLSFSGSTTTVPGQGSVQDEDVVYDNAGTWSVYFDGTAHGLTSDNLDVDAFDVP